MEREPKKQSKSVKTIFPKIGHMLMLVLGDGGLLFSFFMGLNISLTKKRK